MVLMYFELQIKKRWWSLQYSLNFFMITFVDFSFSCLCIELAELISKQNIRVVDRQAFIHYCELHQVCGTKTPRTAKKCHLQLQCTELDCDEEYIGETSRILGERYKEHLKEPSPIHVHCLQTGHSATTDNFNIIGRKDQGLIRLIEESIYIRVNNPTLNRNIGKFNLSHIWDRVFLNTPGLKLNSNKGQVQIHNNRHSQPVTPLGQSINNT